MNCLHEHGLLWLPSYVCSMKGELPKQKEIKGGERSRCEGREHEPAGAENSRSGCGRWRRQPALGDLKQFGLYAGIKGQS